MPTFKFSSKLGTCADKLWKLRETKREAKKVVDKIEAEEKALKLHIINTLPKSKASGISGQTANVKVISKRVPKMEDRIKFNKYVQKTGRFDLLQKRLSEGAINEMWENGEKVPGVTEFNVITVSLTKV